MAKSINKRILIIMGIIIISIAILFVISIRNSYKDPGVKEISTKCFVIEKGINPDRSKYVVVNHILIHDRGDEEKIEVESEMVWNLIEENQEYSMTYKISETTNELAEIRRVPEFDNNDFHSNYQLNKMQMWVSSDKNHISRISTTSDIDDINRVIQILDGLEWQEGVLDYNDEADYGFWISKEPHEERLVSCDVWIKEDDIIVLDIKTRKYAISNDAEASDLISIIKEIISK